MFHPPGARLFHWNMEIITGCLQDVDSSTPNQALSFASPLLWIR